MKINFGCGHKKLPGFLNVDKAAECGPDQVLDMELFPWPLADNCAEEIKIHHVLEHVGANTQVHQKIIQELYRICAPGCTLQIIVPHPRSDNFLTDPTHVRPITAELFNLYSREYCENARKQNWATTPLALYWKVDFKVEKVTHHLMPDWREKFNRKKITQEELLHAVRSYNNVVNELEILLTALKPK